MVATRDRAVAAARNLWGRVDLQDLDGTYPKDAIEGIVASLQRRGVILSIAYLSSFVDSELGHKVKTAKVDTRHYVGFSRGGEPLSKSLDSPLIAVKAAIKDDDALHAGLERLTMQVGLDVDHAVRTSFADAMAKDPRIAGWRRAVRGTCGACLGLADESLAPPGEDMRIHPNCQCVQEPVLKNAIERFPRPSGTQIFNGLTNAAQAAAVGAEAAAKVRAGEIELKDLVATSALATQADFITQRPNQDL